MLAMSIFHSTDTMAPLQASWPRIGRRPLAALGGLARFHGRCFSCGTLPVLALPGGALFRRSCPDFRSLVPETIKGMVFGTRVLKYWALEPSWLLSAAYSRLHKVRMWMKGDLTEFLDERTVIFHFSGFCCKPYGGCSHTGVASLITNVLVSLV